VGALGDAELLALVLETGSRGRTALVIATELIERFEGLGTLARRQTHELLEVDGVGLARAVRLHAALELGRRALGGAESGPRVIDPASAYALFAPWLANLADEELHGLYLDRRRRPLARRRLTRGSDGFTVVDPRQVFRVAVGVGASAVILAHNHPSGDPTPSHQDREVTERVARAGRILGVPLLDHLVIGRSSYVSMASLGDLPPETLPGPGWTADAGDGPLGG
jgi:DNA repair protein RadC